MIAGEDRDTAILTLQNAKVKGKLRQLVKRNGLYVDGNEKRLAQNARCSENSTAFEQLDLYSPASMRQGQTDLSPSLLVEDIAKCDVLTVAAKYLKLDRLRSFPNTILHSNVTQHSYIPVLHRATGRVKAYKFTPSTFHNGARVLSKMVISDGVNTPVQICPAEANDIPRNDLIHIPFFSRPGVLLFLDTDEANWLLPRDGSFADRVNIPQAELRLSSTTCSGVFAVIVPDRSQGNAKEVSCKTMKV